MAQCYNSLTSMRVMTMDKPIKVPAMWPIVTLISLTLVVGMLWAMSFGARQSCAQGLEECRTWTYTINGTSAIVTKCCVSGECRVTCSGSACDDITIEK